MVNLTLFPSRRDPSLPATDTCNGAGAPAYALPARQALAQFAATGCLNHCYYSDAEAQLQQVLELCAQLDDGFIARTALYARERAAMKDLPALLCAVLAARGSPWLATVFERVIDNGRMLRNFVQILRSGATGRRSLGSRPKRLVQQWLNRASEAALLSACVGTQPSLSDIVRMVHPKPAEAWRSAWFAWLNGLPYDVAALPPLTARLQALRRGEAGEIPPVPFQLLTHCPLSAAQWAAIARQAGWQMLRMNLNTFARHGVFEQPGMLRHIAKRLSDAEAIRRARVFPYQLLAAARAAQGLPDAVQAALARALDLALKNVPRLAGRTVVCPDVSGSMHAPVTGWRPGASSRVRCVDVAALVAAAFVARCPGTRVLPFREAVVELELDARAGVLANAERLAAIGPGGTDCSAPLRWLEQRRERVDTLILVSDNESWIDARRGASATLQAWERLRRRHPQARLVCIDLVPNAHTQAPERADILNVGGFSDAVFEHIAAFSDGRAQHWVEAIDAIVLQADSAAG